MSARSALEAYMAHESDEDAAEFGRRIDAVVADALNEAAVEMDAHCEKYGVLGVGDKLRRLAASSSRTAADEQPESERLREELAAAKASAERHRENAYKQGQLAARRLDRARRAEAQRDTLEAELAQAIEHRDHWHGELKCADARIAELGAASSPRTADEQPETERLRAELDRVRAERDELYSEADRWRESYRIAKGYTDDELNARVAIDEATALHRHPCHFPSSPDCTCTKGGAS